jgi:hypothetical protein
MQDNKYFSLLFIFCKNKKYNAVGRFINLIRPFYYLRPCFVVAKHDLQRQAIYEGGDLLYHSQRSHRASTKQKIC